MIELVDAITSILEKEDIGYEESFYNDYAYINIGNSSTMTRIKVWTYDCAGTKCGAVEVQEFDEFGNQTYSKEFASIHTKPFINRIKKNLG